MYNKDTNHIYSEIFNKKYAVLLDFIRTKFGAWKSSESSFPEDVKPEEIKKAVTDIIQENQKFTEYFFNAPVAYVILDTHYKISEINVLGCKFLKIDEIELKGRLFSDFIPAENHDAFQFFMKNLKAGKPNVQCELELNNSKNVFRISGVSGMEKEIKSQTYRLIFFDSSKLSDEAVHEDLSAAVNTDDHDEERIRTNLNQPKYSADKILENLTILAADDDEVTRYYLSELLEQKCLKMFFAKNGKEAVEIFENNPSIDLILMDIKMPVMDGYSATIKIKETDKNVIVIAQTAYALASDREKALAAGCNDYIAKPLMKKDLFSVIQKFFK